MNIRSIQLNIKSRGEWIDLLHTALITRVVGGSFGDVEAPSHIAPLSKAVYTTAISTATR